MIPENLYIPITQQLSYEQQEQLKTLPLLVKNLLAIEWNASSQQLLLSYKKYPEEVVQHIVTILNDWNILVMTETISFAITGMSCASCSANAAATLNNQVGIIHATVNYTNERALVTYIPSLIQVPALQRAVQASGYNVILDTDHHNADYKDTQYKQLRRKAIGSLFFAIPLFIIGMFFPTMPYANYMMWILSTPLVFYYGRLFFVGAWKQLLHKKANMDTLVAISTGTAYLYSVVATLYFAFFSQEHTAPHVYFEAAGIVIAFVLIGKMLEEKAKGQTASAIKKLMGLQPKEATVVNDSGTTTIIPIAQIQLGDILLIKPGEKISVDGIVVDGNSYVDESSISGEPVPVLKAKDAQVYAGTLNQKGSFKMKAKQIGEDTLLAQIIKMVEAAQGSKAPVQKIVDSISSVFVPVVISIAILSFLSWFFWGGTHGWTQGLEAFVTVLIIACPCALGLATPTAIMVGIEKGAKKGILIKDAESLERTQYVDAVILDKTGTITEGEPKVNDILWLHKSDVYQNILYSMELSSEHPLATAITQYLQAENTQQLNTPIENITGQGLQGWYQNEIYYIGNEHFIASQGIHFENELQQWMQKHYHLAQTVVLFTNQKMVLAAIAIADTVKPTSAHAIKQLQQRGIDTYMLTGDNQYSAAIIAQQVGITHYQSDMLPVEKADYIKNLQAQGRVVAMIGDGINDSNALAQADISIAMGKGSDIAMDVAQMTIISSDLTKILDAVLLSKMTNRAIKQNLFWAFIYNIISIPIAAGILYPINGFMLDPMWAGAAMAFSSVSVVGNSLRVHLKK
jgi:Cu2+-exporting ATPase